MCVCVCICVCLFLRPLLPYIYRHLLSPPMTATASAAAAASAVGGGGDGWWLRYAKVTFFDRLFVLFFCLPFLVDMYDDVRVYDIICACLFVCVCLNVSCLDFLLLLFFA